MTRQRIWGFAFLGCALVALLIAHTNTRVQAQTSPSAQRQSNTMALEGPAIHVLVTARLPRWELRDLVTASRTARKHHDLAEYYGSKAGHLEAEAQRNEWLARAFGARIPLSADSHFSGGRDAFHYQVRAKECLRQAQAARLLAALYAQAAQGEGCFRCHSLHGRGGKVGPDLAMEGTRGRSNNWLIGHFKDPQAYSPNSVMPAVGGLTRRQLEQLATFLKFQKKR